MVPVGDVATRSSAAFAGADEVLVVGYSPGDEPSPWPVLAQVPPLVTILRASIEDVPVIATRARLTIGRRSIGVTEQVGDERVLDELDDGARLYVSAWLESPALKASRPGDGLAWDAPGFEPPDQGRSN